MPIGSSVGLGSDCAWPRTRHQLPHPPQPPPPPPPQPELPPQLLLPLLQLPPLPPHPPPVLPCDVDPSFRFRSACGPFARSPEPKRPTARARSAGASLPAACVAVVR